MSEYKNLEEVLAKAESVLAIDILQHALCLDEKIQHTMEPPEEGLYIVGGIEPLISAKKHYHYRSEYERRLVIGDLKNIFKQNEDILNHEGTMVISAKDLKLKKKYLTFTPNLPVTAVKVGAAVVMQFLNNLNRYTRSQSISYRLNRFIKPEFQDWIEREEYALAFERLLDEVSNFVGKDTWHIYFCRMRGTTLLIDKMIDYRIYKYYEQLFAQHDENT